MSPQEAKKEIEQLTEKINYHNDLYYKKDRTQISDLEFDKLLEKLIQLEIEFPQLKDPNSPTQRVGGTITKEFATVYHKYPMLSLSNTYSEKELLDFDVRVAKALEGEAYEYFCELKFDGVSISLTYENGRLTRGVTRGDGVRGERRDQGHHGDRRVPEPAEPTRLGCIGTAGAVPHRRLQRLRGQRQRHADKQRRSEHRGWRRLAQRLRELSAEAGKGDDNGAHSEHGAEDEISIAHR